MRKFLISGLVTLICGLGSFNAFAHGEISSTFPEKYSNILPIPTEVWIQFDSELQTIDGETINSLEVEDSTGLVVSFGDLLIEGGKISTKVSGQSVAGVFTVRYRIVSQDGHPVEGDYTFNASPDYSASEQLPVTSAETGPNVLVRGTALAVFLLLFMVVIALTKKKGSK